MRRGVDTLAVDRAVLVANKFPVTVNGSADAAEKISYAQAVDVGKLSKM